MLLFRSLVVGLLGACCLLLAMQRPPQVVVVSAPPVTEPSVAFGVMPSPFATPWGAFDDAGPPPAEASTAAAAVTVIDVAPGVTGELLAQMIVLAANEHIIAINDAPAQDARKALAAMKLRQRQYVDVSIASDVGATRRVLVLAR